MKVLTVGHKYELAWFEPFTIQSLPPGGEPVTVNPDGTVEVPGQTIQFIEKKPKTLPQSGADSPSGEMETVNNGTTNEEVIRVLIDRLTTMNAKFPCRENSIVLTHLETALLWLHKRTNDRKERGVEGKALV